MKYLTIVTILLGCIIVGCSVTEKKYEIDGQQVTPEELKTRYLQKEKDLEEELGRKPTDEETTEALGEVTESVQLNESITGVVRMVTSYLPPPFNQLGEDMMLLVSILLYYISRKRKTALKDVVSTIDIVGDAAQPVKDAIRGKGNKTVNAFALAHKKSVNATPKGMLETGLGLLGKLMP